MHPLLFDIETVPLPEKELLDLMPPELSSPQMPSELKIFVEPDLSGCPKYNGDINKQMEWQVKTREKSLVSFNEKVSAWQQKAMDEKAKFIGEAALHAPRGKVKLTGYRDVINSLTTIVIADSTKEEQAKINAVKDWPCKVKFFFLTEKETLNFFHEAVYSLGESITPKSIGGSTLIGYYISEFDFRFLIRRAMITGAKIPKRLIKTPRYFDDDLYIDLRDVYLMGEKQLSTDGLDGMAKILGCKRKTASGEGFWSMWRDNPASAILYHINEMDTIEECSRKMGVIA